MHRKYSSFMNILLTDARMSYSMYYLSITIVFYFSANNSVYYNRYMYYILLVIILSVKDGMSFFIYILVRLGCLKSNFSPLEFYHSFRYIRDKINVKKQYPSDPAITMTRIGIITNLICLYISQRYRVHNFDVAKYTMEVGYVLLAYESAF